MPIIVDGENDIATTMLLTVFVILPRIYTIVSLLVGCEYLPAIVVVEQWENVSHPIPDREGRIEGFWIDLIAQNLDGGGEPAIAETSFH